MNRLNKTEFAIFAALMLSSLPKDLTNQNLFLLEFNLLVHFHTGHLVL